MKALRGLGSVLISIILFALVLALSFSYILEGFLKKDLLNGVVKDKLLNQYENSEVETSVKEGVEELLGKNEISSLASDVIDEYIKYSKDNNYEVSEELLDKIIDFCVKNNESISKISKENISIEEMKSEKTRENLRKSINETFSKAKEELDENGEIIVEVYGYIVSRTSRLIVIGLIVMLIILLALINWSLIGWMPYLGVPLILSGLVVSLIYIAIIKFRNDILREIDFTINLNPKTMLIIGLCEIAFGIILIVIKNIMSKNVEIVTTEN